MRKISEHVWMLECSEATDRPNLYLICGERFNVAIDAGNSAKHTTLFYEELLKRGIALPQLTLITHWHWDHTFGMHAVHGLTMASKKTAAQLQIVSHWNWDLPAMKNRLKTKEEIPFCHTHILEEYPDLREIQVVTPDLQFEGSIELDLGNIVVKCQERNSPHERDNCLVFVDDCLILGDSSYVDFYHGNQTYDPILLKEWIAYLKEYPTYRFFGSHSVESQGVELIEELEEELKKLQ